MDNQETIKSNIGSIFSAMKNRWPDEIDAVLNYYDSCDSKSETIKITDIVAKVFSDEAFGEIIDFLKSMERWCIKTREALSPKFNVRNGVPDYKRQITSAILVGHMLETNGELVRVWEWWSIKETNVAAHNEKASSSKNTITRNLRKARDDFETVKDLINEDTTYRDYIEFGCSFTPPVLFKAMKRALLKSREI